jgi:hypothetical protein
LITLPELLEDPKYREFFKTVPKTLKPVPGQKPWRVLIQRKPGGPWAKKEYERYADAFRTIAAHIRADQLHDGAIQSRGIAFGPPQRVAKLTKGGRPVYHLKDGKRVIGPDGKPIQKTVVVPWKPKLDAADEPHTWCTYCRRPTVFRWFRSHHALRTAGLQGLADITDRRCVICGARESFIRDTAGNARTPDFNPLTHMRAGKRSRARR